MFERLSGRQILGEREEGTTMVWIWGTGVTQECWRR